MGRRRTGEQTRALLLGVGMEMVFERGISAGIQHIRLQDVLRRAGLTTGAAYRLWADQSDYQRDLAVAMMRLRITGPADYARDAVVDLIDSGAPGDDVIRAAALAHVRTAAVDTSDAASARDAQSFLIAIALRAAATTWPELREASHVRHHESIAAFAEFYSFLMQSYGLRVREGLTITDFTEAMAAMGEGFALRALEGLEHPTYDFTETDEMPPGPWTLFALGVRALVNEFMVPIDTESPTARTAVDRARHPVATRHGSGETPPEAPSAPSAPTPAPKARARAKKPRRAADT